MKIHAIAPRLLLHNHSVKAGLVLAVLLLAGLAYVKGSAPVQSRKDLPTNPMAGRIVFEEKGCIDCHAIDGYGGNVGPDLGQDQFFGGFYDLASRLWNHAPAMMVQAGSHDAKWSMLTTNEVDDLIAYLFYLRYLGEPGNISKGRQLIKDKGCLKCHTIDDEGEESGIPLDRLKAYASPLYVAQVIWNHGPDMQDQMKAMGIEPPRFEDESITHISAYLREFSRGTSGRRLYMSPGNPAAGEEVFKLKGCSVCHQGQAGDDVEVPLEEMDLHRSVTAIAGTMWNHSQLMLDAMQQKGLKWPSFEGSEMADLIAYMYFYDYLASAGKPDQGRVIFGSKGCNRCHDSVEDIMSSSSYPLATPSDLIRTMWNHVPHMRELVLTRNIDWPELSPAELRNLYAYFLEFKV